MAQAVQYSQKVLRDGLRFVDFGLFTEVFGNKKNVE